MKTLSTVIVIWTTALLATGCDDGTTDGTGGSTASTTSSMSSGQTGTGTTSASGSGSTSTGGTGCAPTVCQGGSAAAQLDPATAFGVVQGVYQGHPDTNCASSALTKDAFTTNKTVTIQVDSNGAIFMTGDGIDSTWSFLAPGDCDFACTDTSGTTWVAFQDDSAAALTKTVTFGVDSGGSAVALTLHAGPDCSIVDLLEI